VGTGDYDWRSFLPFTGHVRGINPGSGAIVNWNNKPGQGFGASDDNWSYGPVQRVDLLRAGIESRRRHTLATVVAAMNRAATQDLRAVRVLPEIAAVLETGPAPSPRAQEMLSLLESWRSSGASRLDRDLDGKIDDPGAAILDAAWPKLADAVMKPVLGTLVDRLATIVARDDPPSGGGGAYYGAWYSYLEKDLRAVLGRPVQQPYATRFCGAGDLAACRASLWAALDEAGAELAARQGSDPRAWRADANAERIHFAGFLSSTMRWTNRPTFQQVISFSGHRPR
jgi:acyl-homoserine lactone acylase PvdQ